VALTEGSREKFARSAVDFVVKYGFDGVDIDWEYPTGGGEPGNIERPEDTDNFVLFLAALREHLNAQGEKDGKEYLLTIALGSARSAYEPLDWSRIVPLLDFINVMTYDMSGGWSSVTGFNSPLYNSSPNPPEGGSIDSVVKALLKLGIPPEKLVVGVPFYGKAWKGVGSKNNGLHQPHRGGVEGDFDYRTIAQNYLGDYERFWDDKAKVPYLYNGEMMITYDDPESIGLKAAYVREQGLGGVMFWELSQDNGDLLTAIDETLNTP
jgi:chitinase